MPAPLLADLAEEVAVLEERLRPVVERPVDRSDPNWFTELMSRMAASDPLAEAGVEAEAQAALRALVQLYGSTDDETRRAVRDLFARNTSFRWAAHVPVDPTPAGFRFRLLHLSAVDQGADPRDELQTLWSLVDRAAAAGVPTREVLVEVAQLSSDVDRYGMGSMRRFLLDCLDRD